MLHIDQFVIKRRVGVDKQRTNKTVHPPSTAMRLIWLTILSLTEFPFVLRVNHAMNWPGLPEVNVKSSRKGRHSFKYENWDNFIHITSNFLSLKPARIREHFTTALNICRPVGKDSATRNLDFLDFSLS